jgi:hypothetical protein
MESQKAIEVKQNRAFSSKKNHEETVAWRDSNSEYGIAAPCVWDEAED